MLRRMLLLMSVSVVLFPLSAQTLTLTQAVEAALAAGADQQLVDANLRSAQASLALAQARAGLSVTSSASYNASQTWNDPSKPRGESDSPLVSTVGSATKDGIQPQNLSGSVTVATPLTNLNLKGTENFQMAPDGTLNQTTSGSATLTQTVWNGYFGGPLQAALDKALLAFQVARLNATVNRNKLILSVKQAFFTLVSAQESIDQLDQTLKQRQESLKFVQAKSSLGQATGLDLKLAQINARTAELDRLGGQSALVVSRRRLANLMGQPDTGVFTAVFEADPPVPAATLDEAVALALKNRVEPQIARANTQSALIDGQLALGASTPSFNLSGGVNYAWDHQTNTSSYVGVLGVTLGLPLIDSGAAVSQGNQAAASQASAQTQEQQLLHSIPVDVTEAWNLWTLNQQRYAVAALSVEVATGQLQVLHAQFDAGLKNLSDLQTSEVTLSTAQFNLLKAKITAQQSALALQNLLGL